MSRDKNPEELPLDAATNLAPYLIVALGLIGKTSSYRELVSLLPAESREQFRTNAFENPHYEAAGSELAEQYIGRTIGSEPGGRNLLADGREYALSPKGLNAFATITQEFAENPTAYPGIPQILGNYALHLAEQHSTEV